MSGDQNIVERGTNTNLTNDGGGRSSPGGPLPLSAEDIHLESAPVTGLSFEIGSADFPIAIVPQEADLRAARLVESFWSEKRQRAEDWPEEGVRHSRLANIARQEPQVQKFLDLNSDPHTRAVDYARIFGAILMYSESEPAAKGDFSGLNLFGIETLNKAAKIEASWGLLKELAKFYVERSDLGSQQALFAGALNTRQIAVEQGWHRFATDYANAVDRSVLASVATAHFRTTAIQANEESADSQVAIYRALAVTADAKLAEKLGCPVAAIPLSYQFFVDGKQHGMLMPDSKTIVKVNQAMLAAEGANMFLFCCPDYSRERLPDGTYHYTMQGLGSGTGLTGERALPVVNDVLARLKTLADSALAERVSGGIAPGPAPLNLRIGFADFEATTANAARCGMGHPDEFLIKLGASAGAVEEALRARLPEGLELIEIHNETTDEDLVGRIEAQVVHRESGSLLANVSIGRVTDTFRDFNLDYQGIGSFNAMVEEVRAEHIRYAAADLSTFAEGKDRQTAEGFRHRLDTLLVLRLDLMLEWKTEEVPPYIRDNLEGRAPFENKAAVIRDLQEGMAAGDPGKSEALQYLRAKIAAQGAEYTVMHKLMGAAPRVVHLYADAANMWQLFGKHSVPRMGVRGGYTGADVVDLG